MPCIYKIQNKQNGKIYIGQTRVSLEWRLNSNWRGHFKEAFETKNGKPLYCALRKYGKEGFTYEVIEERSLDSFKDKNEMLSWLDKQEQYWIAYYDSFNENKGYNMTKGGSGPRGLRALKGIKRSKEFCRAVSEGTLNAMQREDVKEHHKNGLDKARAAGKLSHNKGRTYVTKGDTLRFVFPEEAKRLVEEEGFEYGNKVCGKTIKRKYETDLSYRQKVSEGTKRGMQKSESRQKYLEAISEKRRWITNGIINKRIKESQIDEYIAKGWLLGCQCNRRKEA